MWVLCLVLVLLFSTLCHSSIASALMGKRAGRCTLIVFLMSCDCKHSVALPHSDLGWSAVCDCGIS